MTADDLAHRIALLLHGERDLDGDPVFDDVSRIDGEPRPTLGVASADGPRFFVVIESVDP